MTRTAPSPRRTATVIAVIMLALSLVLSLASIANASPRRTLTISYRVTSSTSGKLTTAVDPHAVCIYLQKKVGTSFTTVKSLCPRTWNPPQSYATGWDISVPRDGGTYRFYAPQDEYGWGAYSPTAVAN